MKKQVKEHVLYDNYDNDFEAAKADYEANNYDEVPGDIEYTQDMFWENEQMNWDDFKGELNTFMEKNKNGWITLGTVGTWQGPKAGGAVVFDVEKLSKIWNGCDYVKVIDKGGHLHFECSHHDGTNYYELKRLSEKGYNYWDKMYNDLFVDPREVHATIFKSNFLSGLPHFAKIVWGC
jgi:hypothetical protein